MGKERDFPRELRDFDDESNLISPKFRLIETGIWSHHLEREIEKERGGGMLE